MLNTKENALKATVNYKVGKLVEKEIEISSRMFFKGKIILLGLIIWVAFWIMKNFYYRKRGRK